MNSLLKVFASYAERYCYNDANTALSETRQFAERHLTNDFRGGLFPQTPNGAPVGVLLAGIRRVRTAVHKAKRYRKGRWA